MSRPGFELRLLEDTLVGGTSLAFHDADVNRVIYVVHGIVSSAGISYSDDQAWHSKGSQTLVAGSSGATIWRFELSPAGREPTRLAPSLGATRGKLAHALDWPVADALLIRNDSVSFPPGGCAYLHTHQGPGIRCLIEGGIRIDTEGHSTSYGPGSAWFEGGPAPVFAQAAMDRPSRFIRVMVLPASFKGRSSISYVNPEDQAKPKSQSYKGYVDELIEI
jgi:hypothetical protein